MKFPVQNSPGDLAILQYCIREVFRDLFLDLAWGPKVNAKTTDTHTSDSASDLPYCPAITEACVWVLKQESQASHIAFFLTQIS